MDGRSIGRILRKYLSWTARREMSSPGCDYLEIRYEECIYRDFRKNGIFYVGTVRGHFIRNGSPGEIVCYVTDRVKNVRRCEVERAVLERFSNGKTPEECALEMEAAGVHV